MDGILNLHAVMVSLRQALGHDDDLRDAVHFWVPLYGRNGSAALAWLKAAPVNVGQRKKYPALAIASPTEI